MTVADRGSGGGGTEEGGGTGEKNVLKLAPVIVIIAKLTASPTDGACC